MRRARFVLAGSLFALLLAPPSFAEDAPVTPPPSPSTAAPSSLPPDAIYTKSGGLMRGTLVDVVPNQYARIRLDSGEIVIVPWAEIARIDARNAPPSAGAVPLPTAPPPEPPKPNVRSGPTVVVHIDSPKPVRLERFDPSRPNWDDMCTSPCDVAVPVDGEYRLVGTDLMASSRFTLEANHGDRVVLDVSTASKWWFAAGVGMGGAGIIVAVYGLFFYGEGALFSSAGDSQSKQFGDGEKAVGVAVIAAGAIISGIGVLLMISHWGTSASQSVTPVTDRTPIPEAMRAPSWRTDDVARALPKPQMFAPMINVAF
jgi:hypothetical protein